MKAISGALRGLSIVCLVLVQSLWAGNALALTAEDVKALALGDNEARIAIIGRLVSAGDASALPLLAALEEGIVKVAGGQQVFIVRDHSATDALTGKAVDTPPEDAEDVMLNNRVRRELGSAIATLRLVSPDRGTRLAAARDLQNSADEDLLPLLAKALAGETDAEVKGLLVLAHAGMQLKSADTSKRFDAVKALGASDNPNTKTLLLALLERKGSAFAEPDPMVRLEAEKSLRAVESRLSFGDQIGRVFSGVSLGTILLLAALGLAITYGLMGVINMAHGELIMVGAYSTYVIQNVFRAHFPGAFDWYLVCAVPAAFLAAALVGVLLERAVIRFLYGRPLETLLATWGISLVLIQTVRTVFGAQNVQVENPVWMSGGFQFMSNIVLPYNRIAIIFFAALVLVLVWMLLTRTRLGLFVRGVTQNRAMAGCVGVPTSRVDTLAFGLGSGIAGLAGCALSQIGNVGPDLGQAYIVDCFMVVVLGGVGQLAGTVYAALGLGIVNKFLEAWSGAVIAKIAVLVFIIFFIQKRPQGLFALKGRMSEN